MLAISLYASSLAGPDIGAQTHATIDGRIAVTGEIDHGLLAIAEGREKSYVDEVIIARGASLLQGIFISILAQYTAIPPALLPTINAIMHEQRISKSTADSCFILLQTQMLNVELLHSKRSFELFPVCLFERLRTLVF